MKTAIVRRPRPVVCLVTDRRRLPGAAGGPGRPETLLLELIGAAVGAGVDLIQLRERDLDGRRLTDLLRAAVAAAAGSDTLVVVNDRVDVALAAGADGVHLRSDSIEAPLVRRIAPAGFLVGRSVHRIGEALGVAARGGVDYLVLGTLFPTVSKPDSETTSGVEDLARLAASCPLPLLGIGGVSLACLPAVARAGAAGFAAVGFFITPADERGDRIGLSDAISRARRAFDTPGHVA